MSQAHKVWRLPGVTPSRIITLEDFMKKLLSIMASAVVLCSLAFTPALAMDKGGDMQKKDAGMMKDDGMQSGDMNKGGMMKDDGMKEGKGMQSGGDMGKEGMMKDGDMKKGSDMGKKM